MKPFTNLYELEKWLEDNNVERVSVIVGTRRVEFHKEVRTVWVGETELMRRIAKGYSRREKFENHHIVRR